MGQFARDYLGKGRILVSGPENAVDRCVKLINDWIWCSYVGQAILEEIVAGPRTVGFTIAAQTTAPELETQLPSDDDRSNPEPPDSHAPKAYVNIVLGPDLAVLERLNPPLLQVPSAAVSYLRTEFVLMHELTHANRLARGKVQGPAVGDGLKNTEEAIAIAITNMLMSEKGVAKLRKSYDSAEALDLDPAAFVRVPAQAAVVRRIVQDHPVLKQRLNNDISPVRFNPIFALLQGK